MCKDQKYSLWNEIFTWIENENNMKLDNSEAKNNKLEDIMRIYSNWSIEKKRLKKLAKAWWPWDKSK